MSKCDVKPFVCLEECACRRHP